MAVTGWAVAPHTVALVVFPLYIYFRFLRTYRPSRAEAARFAAGVVALFVALLSPMHRVADTSSFFVHVLQHMLLQMVAPPLMLLGVPRRAWARVHASRSAARWFPMALHPLVVAAAYNGVLFFWHWPMATTGGGRRLACGVFSDLASQTPAIGVLQDLLPLLAGLLFWAGVLLSPPLSPAPVGTRVAMLFGSMIVNWLVSFVIALTDTPMYATYAGARPPFGLGLLADQKLGAGIMWEHGNMTYVIALIGLVRGLLRGQTAPEGPPTPDGLVGLVGGARHDSAGWKGGAAPPAPPSSGSVPVERPGSR